MSGLLLAASEPILHCAKDGDCRLVFGGWLLVVVFFAFLLLLAIGIGQAIDAKRKGRDG